MRVQSFVTKWEPRRESTAIHGIVQLPWKPCVQPGLHAQFLSRSRTGRRTSPLAAVPSPNSTSIEVTPQLSVSTPGARTSGPQLAAGWMQHTHLHGGLYFSFDKGRFVTSENVYDAEICRRMRTVYNAYHRWIITAYTLDLTGLVLYETEDGKFFLASWTLGETYEFDPNVPDKYVKHEDDEHFWEYACNYPMHHEDLPRFIEAKFLSALAYGSNERVLDNQDTNFPFEDAQIARLLHVYRDLKGPDATPSSPLVPALTYHIASTMREVTKTRRRYGYGTASARIYRDIAIPPSTWTVVLWDAFFAIVLCGTHKNYRTRLEGTVPRGAIALKDFRQLMRNLMSEWADSNLVATVLVSVNVGFLAVPDINGLQRASCLVSSILATTSIVTGLHHVWQHREKTEIGKEDARRYLYYLKLSSDSAPANDDKSESHPLNALDLTLTACLLAVPLATLQWSVLSFTLTIAAYAYQSTAHTVGPAHALLLALIALLAVLACTVFVFFWRIWTPPAHLEREEETTGDSASKGGTLKVRDANIAEAPPPAPMERLGEM
ncbi:hypothetical protein C8R43DRAFT_3084 [Mycena crocata]|nr:hypothetical protein C8R43DRAFT_3084 [Mycena crocata]